jgi:hypothetical protein
MPTSIPLQPTITTAGLAAIFNAQNTGVEFALTHIAFGTAQYTPDGSETALRTEKVRVPIAGGGRISPTQIQIYAIAMAVAGNPFFVGEVGFFGNNGATLLAVYSSTGTPGLYLSDTVATSVSYALGLAALPANSVTVTIDPSASAALLLMGNHVTAADPHPQYVQKVNGVAFYDPTIAFNQGAEIIGDDLLVYQSAQANNIGNTPSSSPAWWVPLYNYGDTPVAGLTNANVTLSSTQAARAHITFSGALTANLNIVFPNWVKDWTVVNNTTGAFSLTCKTAAGTGVAIPQNGSPTKIRGDGTNIGQLPENVAAATQPQHPPQIGQVQSSASNVGIDTGAANAYVVAFAPAMTAPVPWAPFWFKVKTTNTGPSTLNATGTAYGLVGGAHAALQGGEMVANGDALVYWNPTLAAGAGSYVLMFCSGAPEQIAPPTQSQHAAQFANIGNFQSIQSVSGNVTLTAASFGLVYEAATGDPGGRTITFPSAAGNAGKVIVLINSSSGNWTLNAGNINSAYGSGSSIVMPSNSTGMFVSDNTSFNAVGGSAAFGSGVRPQVTTGVGQWVSLNVVAGTSGYISLPAGGTWAYTFFNQTTAQSGVGIAAGGTTLLTGAAAGGSGIANAFGFCWRIA